MRNSLHSTLCWDCYRTLSSRVCFLLRPRPQIQTQTQGRGRSEARAAVQHAFDVLHYTNMLIKEGTIIPIAVTDILHFPLVTCRIVKHCTMFIVRY